MATLKSIHVLAMLVWFGGAAIDIVLEVSAWRSASIEFREKIIRVHHLIDVVFEGPGIIITLITGAVLLGQYDVWPNWLRLKVACGILAAAVNLICITFVVRRAQTPRENLLEIEQLNQYIRYTGLGVPFALSALWLGLFRLS